METNRTLIEPIVQDDKENGQETRITSDDPNRVLGFTVMWYTCGAHIGKNSHVLPNEAGALAIWQCQTHSWCQIAGTVTTNKDFFHAQEAI
jgi:hypothetical protein